MSNKIIARILGSFSIAIMFIFFFIIYAVLLDLPLSDNPSSKVILESGQKATQNVFNWWLVVDAIGGIILFAGIIFGIFKLVTKITENESRAGFIE